MQTVKQKNSKLYINFEEFNKSVQNMYVKNEFDSLAFEKNTGKQSFIIDLEKVIDVFDRYATSKLYIVVEEKSTILTTQKNLKINTEQTEVYRLSEVTYKGVKIYPYISKNGFLHLSMSEYEPNKVYFSRRHIDNMKINNSMAFLKGQFSILNSNLEEAQLLIKTRFTEKETLVNISLDNLVQKSNISTYNFSVDIYSELIEFMKYPFENEDVIDIFLNIKIQESKEAINVKLGNPRILVERLLKGEIITNFNNEIVSITPYLTMKGRNLSFRINRYSLDSYLSYIESVKKSNIVNLLKNSDRKIWVIGEKSYKAQDNGYHFFKYLRSNHPEIPAYYIIEENSKEAKNVLPLGNVIFYKSPEHFDIMLKADYICTTHHPELIYPTNSSIYTRKIKATKVFLQHGVLGTKNLRNINGNHLKDFNVDLFITSSQREKKIVVRDLNFYENQVKVTGLARFDELFDSNTNVKNQIIIMPTWRDWLINIEQLKKSEYLRRINSLLYSSKLKELAKQGTDIVLCLHPNMQPFVDLFDIPSYVSSVKQGEIDVQRLIKESKLMITDYSSVAFDFSFLKKPVIYYQFDKSDFLGKEPSHIDIETELPGIIVNSQHDLEKELNRLKNKDYVIDQDIEKRMNKFIENRDKENSYRIYKEIINYKNKSKIKNKIKYDILTKHLFKRFRKSKKYFKVMDILNTLLTKITPTQQDLIVFESNVGKSVSDSPKVIYEELQKQSKKYKIVWVTNKQYPFNESNVISVKRLSPEYYYYLSRAKYWVNNQNFPHYINKSKDTIYIQTWHGTPLKKMLNDVDSFKGRDKGYKYRVNHAIKYWDYLISPSPYASACFKTAFNFKKDILEIGYPRNDIFYKENVDDLENKKSIVKQQLGIKDNRKIILYAPTFRDHEITKAKKHSIDLKLDLQKMKRNFEKNYILIIRPHIIISNSMKLEDNLENFVVNAANYNDISDLYLISDICITDYSSVMFDFANTKKPLLFFTYDLDFYKKELRGFYFDFEKEAPGPLIKTNDELVNSIKNIQHIKSEYQKKYDEFYKRFCTFENGTAAKEIVNRFFK